MLTASPSGHCRTVRGARRLNLGTLVAAVLTAITPLAAYAQGNAGTDNAGTDATVIQLPHFPNRTFNVQRFGAKPDGQTKDTKAFQNALNACQKAGGGTVLVPGGRYLVGQLILHSNTNFHLAKGATILMSTDTSDYTLRRHRFHNEITADHCHDLAITGKGTINGQGRIWWHRFRTDHNFPHRPYMIKITNRNRLLVQGVTLTRSPMFHLVPEGCQNVTIKNIRIIAPADAPNTDGIDPSGWNFLIENCYFNVGDDCIALKPSHPIHRGKPACLNFIIRNCRFIHGHGMSIGGQTPGGLNHMLVENCIFDHTHAGMRMKAARGSGGLVQNVTYKNLKMKNVEYPIRINSYYGEHNKHINQLTDPAQRVTKTTPIWRNIHVINVTASGGKYSGRIDGLPEMPVQNVTFRNCRFSAQRPLRIYHATGIRFVNSTIKTPRGQPKIVAYKAQVQGMPVHQVRR